jgi:hypothetical protein
MNVELSNQQGYRCECGGLADPIVALSRSKPDNPAPSTRSLSRRGMCMTCSVVCALVLDTGCFHIFIGTSIVPDSDRLWPTLTLSRLLVRHQSTDLYT